MGDSSLESQVELTEHHRTRLFVRSTKFKIYFYSISRINKKIFIKNV